MPNLFENQAINNFYDVALQRDFARTNLFRVLNINSGATNVNFGPEDLVYITTTNLPQRSINNVPVPFMGLNFNVPGTVKYPNSEAWNVTFRMPQDLGIRRKLEQWSRGTFDEQGITGSSGAYNLGDTGSVELALMGKGGQVIANYTLFGAYCSNIGEYALDVTASGEIVTQTATIAYSYWSSTLAI